MQDTVNYNSAFDMDEEINIDLKKIFLAVWSRKILAIKIFFIVLLYFIISTYTTPKIWTVDADLYINKSNNSNMAEINPYILEEMGAGSGMAALMSGGGNSALNNELEIMKSPLVIDKVVKENNLKFGKLYGFIPTKKTGEYLTADKFLKKGLNLEVKKGTNVVSISYKNKDKDLAYNVVTSIIQNYAELRKELLTEKSKSDKKILETEYQRVKADLDKHMKNVSGMPSQSLAGSGNLAAMSTFSKSASKALSSMQGHLIAGEKSKIALTEDSEKLSHLASKLQWANLVEDMSDSSKIILLKEPKPLRDWEYTSPKLFTNILIGIIFGVIFALIAIIASEIFDKKLSFSMLGNDVIYNTERNPMELKRILLTNNTKKIAIVTFEKIPPFLIEQLQNFHNFTYLQADLSEEFIQNINNAEEVLLLVSVSNTDTQAYKQIRTALKDMNKHILREVLI